MTHSDFDLRSSMSNSSYFHTCFSSPFSIKNNPPVCVPNMTRSGVTHSQTVMTNGSALAQPHCRQAPSA